VTIDLDAVHRAPLFTALDEAASASLRAQMDLVKISKGSVLFAEGADGDHLYVIVEGKLKLGTSVVMVVKIFFQFLDLARCLANSAFLIQAHAHQLQLQ
jgi:hypothetical protein